ncbi:MAG TPA: GNAT family N-acetyltransferase [Bryobacteraceae bacterium]|nr:GNAT family N-acetyltransferase [Bryobacteraceae bacterium]HUO29784.1 GNAT family N-acetyltransferase [Bryobacteraceae bacterium]
MLQVDVLPWDSAFFGIGIARIVPQRGTIEELSATVEQAARGGVACLYWLVGCDDAPSSRAAETCGFHLVDIRMTFEREVIPCATVNHADLPRVRPYAEGDLPALLALAGESHRESRFFFDSNFAPERCSAMYAEWIRRSLRTATDTVLVAGIPGEPAGYCVTRVAAGQTGSIELIAVNPQARQAGVGTALVSAALEQFACSGVRRATVATQGRNIASQRLYQRCGFLTKSVALWYHKWLTCGIATAERNVELPDTL